MDERENGIEIANPNDRLSSSDVELNRLNSVPLIDKQNVNGTNREKTCINNSCRARTDNNINAVASHIKEKLHLSSCNSGLLNGYNCHAECHLNLNGVEESEDISSDEQLKDKPILQKCDTDDSLLLHQFDKVCENCVHEHEPRKSLTLCDNVSECQLIENSQRSLETLSASDTFKLEEKRQPLRYCTTACEKREGKTGDRPTISTVGIHYRCLCKKATTSNCAAVIEEQLPNKSDFFCDDFADGKKIGECSGVINCEGPIRYVGYESENQMPDIMRLIQKDLSEPYSIYTYRYFIHNWPKLCFLAMDGERCVGAIVCKLDIHKKLSKRGYIAMLAVDENYRKKKIGSNLVLKAIQAMIRDEADEVVLETEITNKPALRLYENLGFVRDKRLFRYYLNGVDALRLKLWLR